MKRFAPLVLALSPLALLGAAPAPATPPATSASDWLATVAITPEGGFRQGNPDAPVKLVEYGSRTCPSCHHFAIEAMAPLRATYIATGKVSYEYRDFLVHGAPDLALALLNQCVGTRRFFPVLDALYANQPQFEKRLIALSESAPEKLKAWQKLPPPQMATRFAEALGLIDFIKRQGVTEARARQCLRDDKRILRIARTNSEAQTIHDVSGTPSFFLNGRKLRAIEWQYLQPELRAAGA